MLLARPPLNQIKSGLLEKRRISNKKERAPDGVRRRKGARGKKGGRCACSTPHQVDPARCRKLPGSINFSKAHPCQNRHLSQIAQLNSPTPPYTEKEAEPEKEAGGGAKLHLHPGLEKRHLVSNPKVQPNEREQRKRKLLST